VRKTPTRYQLSHALLRRKKGVTLIFQGRFTLLIEEMYSLSWGKKGGKSNEKKKEKEGAESSE